MAYQNSRLRLAPIFAALIVGTAGGYAVTASAQDAVSSFQTGGSPGQGTEYSASVKLATTDIAEAYAALRRNLERNGWKISHAEPASYALLAQNGQVTASGKTGSLGASLAPVAGGLNLALMYSNPPGVNSPAAAVRAEFNKIGVALQGELSGKPAPTAVASRPAPAVASSAPDRKLCLAGACLGMTPAEVATLNLQPAGMMQFRLGGKNDSGYGLDRAGKRISFSDMGDFDSKSMKQFAVTVDTICRFNFASAKMKASDGQPIHLVFRPVIRSGKGVVVLTSIDRKLPPNTSETELKRFADAAKEQFGDAFSAQSHAIVTRPTAEMHYDVGSGRSLKLSLPIENVHARLMEQAGCSDKPSLD
ncbi:MULTISPECIES: hypothetical protein [unclassified Duganella]|uniref:hypothetical protein n=1 Tax=unclassified Duganella TaxID=2636909 RepID=UPI000883DA5C|nr:MULTISPECIES: hypothetical protein [unclassified Duganella]SDH18308.1 hypothetical protein SAMN05216320_110180 [Duganella sp. OV458]SDK32709.1 hypothetical protein SAMN05428973_110181 [Duganella sp. OV510]